MLKRTGAAAFVFMLFISSAAAEERLGVAVYPGAKFDQAQTKLLQASLSVEGAAYRTNDDIARVIEFYRKQGLLFLKAGSRSKESARFKKTDTGVDVVVQNPSKNSNIGAEMKGTLILIFKKEEKGNKPELAI
ncbi:MAG TPA: hypothetical protein VEM40_03450 [Nitrospirota bacterium]|nr:hypothetical protein [Nitrospirota bacterium]